MPSKDWKETIADGEHELFERYAAELAGFQKARAAKAKQKPSKHRALHAKMHAGVRAEIEVIGDLPDYARVALFAAPKKYEAFVRFSNGSGKSDSDLKGDLRGLALKILGVSGKKLISGMEEETTQDFLFINRSVLPFETVDDFMAVARAGMTPLLFPFRLLAHFGFGFFAFAKRAAAATKPIGSLASSSFFTVAPIRFGDHAARLSLLSKQIDDAPKTCAGPDALREDLETRLAKGELVWELCAQFYESGDKTPIEDTAREWSEADAPWIAIARLTIPSQNLLSDEGKKIAREVESLAFDPWHACEELKPLGAAMRARSPAYRDSQKNREAAREPR